jgi:hypothetical protein
MALARGICSAQVDVDPTLSPRNLTSGDYLINRLCLDGQAFVKMDRMRLATTSYSIIAQKPKASTMALARGICSAQVDVDPTLSPRNLTSGDYSIPSKTLINRLCLDGQAFVKMDRMRLATTSYSIIAQKPKGGYAVPRWMLTRLYHRGISHQEIIQFHPTSSQIECVFVWMVRLLSKWIACVWLRRVIVSLRRSQRLRLGQEIIQFHPTSSQIECGRRPCSKPKPLASAQ